MRVAFKTLGCKANRYESDQAVWELGRDVEIVSEREKVDLYVVNSCTVTHVADQKSRQAVRHLKSLNPEAKVAVFGCGVTVDGGKMFSRIPEVDFIVSDRKQLIEVIRRQRTNFDEQDLISTHTRSYQGGDYSPTRTRALLKIQDGCNAFCTYCVIPISRGRARSIRLDEIIKEAQEKEQAGFKELVLTGINIGTWEQDGKTIADVIQGLLKNTSISRIRISSIEPTAFNAAFYAVLGDGRVCAHIHLCLQSGSDVILQKMRRRYSTDEYRAVVEKIRRSRPGMAITTDVIVGFPFETDQEYQKTKRFCEEVGFAKIHVFPYSKRRGTQAALMPDQVTYAKKMQRSKDLQKCSKILQKDYISSFIGSIQEVLFERQTTPGILEGYTVNYIRVMVQTDSANTLINTLQKVRLIKVEKGERVIGEIV